MAKILVNYIHNANTHKDEILEGKHVFADQKVAVLDTEMVIREPLVVPMKDNRTGAMVSTVVDRGAYSVNNKLFIINADKDGVVYESEVGAEVWLPKDTDVSKLRFKDGRLVMIEEEPKKEETKPVEKKTKKDSEKTN